VQQSKLLCYKFRLHVIYTGYIATWPVEADDEASLNRVNASAENDWNCCGGGFGRKRCLIAAGSGYYSYAPTNQIGGQLRQLAPPHSITSSALASNLGGTSRPIAFAAFRLITKPYLVGACTGKSAGFSPLKIRSTYEAARRYKSIGSGP
jgi:hypothetical protein